MTEINFKKDYRKIFIEKCPHNSSTIKFFSDHYKKYFKNFILSPNEFKDLLAFASFCVYTEDIGRLPTIKEIVQEAIKDKRVLKRNLKGCLNGKKVFEYYQDLQNKKFLNFDFLIGDKRNGMRMGDDIKYYIYDGAHRLTALGLYIYDSKFDYNSFNIDYFYGTYSK